MTLDLNALTGPQRKIIRAAFLDAFDQYTLARLLLDYLDKRLMNIVAPSDLETMTFELINVSAREGWTDKLISAAEQDSNNARIANLRATLATTVALNLPAIDAEVKRKAPATAGGLERMVRNGGFADWGLWVDRMAEIGRRICSIQYPVGVKLGGGTAFLVASDLVLTNYHVIEDHKAKILDPSTIVCQFDLAAGSAGPIPVRLHADWLVDWSGYSTHDPGDTGGLPDVDQLDYALLRLAQHLGDQVIDGAKRGWLTLDGATSVPSSNEILFIGQHPRLQPLKLAVGEVLTANANSTRIRYDANTDRGSSGSPCVDMHLNVVALHHAGDPDYTKLLGDYNQGIPVGLIVKRMAARGVTKFWT